MGSTHLRRSRRALAAATMFGMVGGSLVATAPANAAVMVSGSLVDPAGNYAEGTVTAYTTGGVVAGRDTTSNGAFDIPLDDGAYTFRFDSFEFASEYYRDKADLATADVVTVAGAAQTLAAWTVDRNPSVLGVVRTADGRGVSGASIEAYEAATGDYVTQAQADNQGSFRLSIDVPVKLRFSGYDSRTGDNLASEWFNDKVSQATADVVTPTAAGADVGAVTLAVGGSIAGRVTTEGGAPIYRVEACAEFRCDWTDANGNYLIEGVDTGDHRVRFTDPVGEFVGEYFNNIPLSTPEAANVVAVAPGQAVTAVDAGLAVAPVVAPNGVDLSGTVKDELGNPGIAYKIDLHSATPDERDSTVVATTWSNRAGQYAFTELDRIGGVTQFKLEVVGGGAREKGDFARRTTWSGDKLDFGTATVVTAAAPRTLDITLPVAGGVSGAVTSEAGGVPEFPTVSFRNSDNLSAQSASVEADGTYDQRTVWAGEYTVLFGGYNHVSEWWKDALPEDATTITVKPGQVTTGISAALSKDVKAIERPAVEGDAWVGQTLSVDPGRWNTQASSKLSYEWLVGSTVVGTGSTFKLAKSHLGKKLVARVTNDAGFAQGQAVTAATAKVGYKPKLKAKVSPKRAVLTLKVKPLKAKKVKASVVLYVVKGTNAAGEPKLKKIGKGKVVKGKGVVKIKKALRKGKHTLVFRIKGKGKVGSGDLTKKVKIKR